MNGENILMLIIAYILIMLLIAIIVVIIIINKISKPPKCLKNKSWEINGIRSDYFKRIDKDTAKVVLELRLKDHSNVYFKYIKVIIKHIENINEDKFECWKVISNNELLSNVTLQYNGYHWYYCNNKLVSFRIM